MASIDFDSIREKIESNFQAAVIPSTIRAIDGFLSLLSYSAFNIPRNPWTRDDARIFEWPQRNPVHGEEAEVVLPPLRSALLRSSNSPKTGAGSALASWKTLRSGAEPV